MKSKMGKNRTDPECPLQPQPKRAKKEPTPNCPQPPKKGKNGTDPKCPKDYFVPNILSPASPNPGKI